MKEGSCYKYTKSTIHVQEVSIIYICRLVLSPCIMCSVPWRVFSTVGDIMSTVGDILSTVGDILSTVGGYLEYRTGYSVPCGD